MGSPGPDFLVVGMQKAGTGWLYDQLAVDPAFRMPPIKELHFFNGGYNRIVQRVARAGAAPGAPSAPPNDPQGHFASDEAADTWFIERFADFDDDTDVEDYKKLFSFKGDKLSGDITPAYCLLSRGSIRRVVSALPQAKIILIVREPIERLWSQISMGARKDKLSIGDLENAEFFVDLVSSKGRYRNRSFPSVVFRRWSEFVAPENFLCLCFDDLRDDPRTFLDAVLNHIGVRDRAAPTSFVGANRKQTMEKLEMKPAVRAALGEVFAAELQECATLIGGRCTEWPARYGLAAPDQPGA